MNPEDLLSPATPPPCEEEAESVSSLRLLESSPALSEASVESSESKTRGMLLLATRSYSSSEGEDPEDMEDRSALSADSTAPSESKDDQVSEDYEEKGASSSVQGSCSSIQGDSYDGLSPSPPNERASYKRPAQYGDAIDDMEMSVESLMVLAQQRGLATTALSQWSVREDGKLLDPDLRKYRSLRDALRAYTHLCQGAIPREDIYYLAILRRVLAEQDLPLVDGPISVVALGTVVPEDHFYTSKKLFPIGYETLVNVQVTTPTTVAFRLRCKIVHGNKKKSPIFVVELEHSAEIVFRSYVASKAWKKALVHFESLPADELMSVVSESVINIESDSSNTTDVLTPSSGEDGFGLLRRNVTRVLEGLHQVLLCKDYQFWEQRHPITPDVHAKIRSRLKDQAKDILKAQNALSKEEIKWQLSQEVLLEEHAHNPEELYRMRQQKEKDRREADKRSVREAARKLLEIEMKAQEDAKEAQRRAKEERKNALLEAKMEAVRQKEARKEALRLVREEEKRVREEEKEVKRALREEEKRKKLEEKENSMKRRIEELRQRRQMREEQKAILENGVVTSFSPRRFNDSRKRKASGGVPDAQTIRQQHLALLKFVEEEKERRRQIRVWEKKNEVEQFIWTRVKTQYMQGLDNDRYLDRKLHSGPDGQDSVATQDSKFPVQATSAAVELAPVPAEAQADLLFVWDFISTFSNCLKLTVLPSLSAFVSMVVVSDGSSPVGDGILDEDSVGSLLASLHADLLKRLLTEYFPVLQLGITIDEFFRTRPMNVFSWPELARLACQLAMEFKHPSGDEHLLKFVKGSKSFRDDSVAQPLRQKLHRRGTNLLKGVKFEEEVDEAEVGPQALVEKVTATQVSEANPSSAASGDYYGVVLANGIQSKFEVGEKDNHLVVTSIVSSSSDKSSTEKTKPTESASPDQKDDNADMVQVGDCLVCINGHDVREMTLGDFKTLVGSLSTPHGLMMSSIVPVVKTQVRHFATTQSSTKMKCCAFVLKLLRSKEIAAPFNQPVDAELYPDYYSSGDIAEPMDLGTISEKIEDEDYENDDVDSFVDDVALVWKNCYTYNSLKAEISNLAQKLAVIFDRLMKEWVYTTDNRPLIAGEEDNCRNCQTIHVKGRLLLCDRCDAPYHTFCLASPLPAIPKGEWFCPTCVADPSFSPEQFRKKARDMTASSSDSSGNNVANEGDFTDLEKRIQCVIDLLSQDNYTKLTVGDRLKVLRVLCELLEETAAVQSIYHSLEEKTSDVRRRLGDPLADLEREWDRFCPPRSSHGVEQTKKFIIDGVEHELTDELLTYLEEKAHAELEAKPVPALPESAQKKLRGEGGAVEPKLADLMCEDENDGDTSDCSEVGEDMIIEELGDRYLLASVGLSSAERGQGGSNEQAVLRSTCAFCGLEDGILNGPLQACKRSPLTADTSLLNKTALLV
ncbi:Methyl-CpG-binding domain-containing protein 9 [Phytophthora boehmeriae]|uniref:Methyl-CpG-binding domain-containing protein 9 n=1 Tax=Phytophthora boehmeriae TaxID=109152 RepID=A0A8T1WS16_9STRA|nr:Methyl-CpG-binding domain-containing protein 9 [Phytophthora boehmeriae]